MEEVSIDSDVITVDSNENTETRKDRRVPNVEIQIGDTQFVKKYFNFTFQLMFLSLDNPTFDRTAFLIRKRLIWNFQTDGATDERHQMDKENQIDNSRT